MCWESVCFLHFLLLPFVSFGLIKIILSNRVSFLRRGLMSVTNWKVNEIVTFLNGIKQAFVLF